jgi:membrane-bound lytic murein transglycosylase D
MNSSRPHPQRSAALVLTLAFVSPLLAQQPPKLRPVFRNLTSGEELGAGEKSYEAAEPPRFEPANPYLQQPTLLIPNQPAGAVLSAALKAIREAEKHFQYGKFFLHEGKPSEARREFDQAIDTLLAVPEDVADRASVERKLEEMARQIHRYDVEGLGAGDQRDPAVFTQAPVDEILNLTFPVDPGLKDRVEASIHSGASQLPLTVNDAVLSYINYFTSPRGQKILLSGLRRAGRYREMITRILLEEGLPAELIFLAQAESGFMPRALSRKSAAGMWQFMRQTGKEYGLGASKLHDDRLDPEKATRAAARHLRDLYQQTGDWHLAMAAYNCGPYCVERAVQRTGYADYWELRRRSALPRETMNYVPAILAMAIVSRDLASYGIAAPEPEPPLDYDTLKISADTNLGLIADAADVPSADVRELNPWLLKNVAPANSEVKVPKGKGEAVLAALDVVPEEKRASWRLHRVANGDTLTAIAKRYATAKASIVAANAQLDPSFFEAPESGEFLLIPASAKEPAKKVTSKSRWTKAVSKSMRAAPGRAKAGRSTGRGRTAVASSRRPTRAVAR